MTYVIMYLVFGLVIAFIINNTFHTFVNVKELAVTIFFYPVIILALFLVTLGMLIIFPLTWASDDYRTEEEKRKSMPYRIMRIFFP